MGGATDVSHWRAWSMAIRPQTLPAGIAPVLVGIAIAVADGMFSPGPAMAALIGALFIQIGTNFANDYYDAMRGVDTEERKGFTRVTQSGLIAPRRVLGAMILTYLAAIVIGFYLVYVGGVPIIVVGLLSIACGVAYAGGPIPFGSYGLGDLFVFIFFGIVAVTGTYYVQAVDILEDPLPMTIPPGTITTDVLITSLSMAALTTALLVVNNLRDIDTDAAAGKRTLAVMIGRRHSRAEYVILIIRAYVVPVVLAARGWGLSVLLPMLSIPLAVVVTRFVLTETGSQLNTALERTGQLLMLFAILFAAGLMLA